MRQNFSLPGKRVTLRPLNGITGHPCHGLPSCQFSASYALPFSTYGPAQRLTDRQTTCIKCIMPVLWGRRGGGKWRDKESWIGTPFLKVWCCFLKIIKISPCWLKLQLAKVGAFFSDNRGVMATIIISKTGRMMRYLLSVYEITRNRCGQIRNKFSGSTDYGPWTNQ